MQKTDRIAIQIANNKRVNKWDRFAGAIGLGSLTFCPLEKTGNINRDPILKSNEIRKEMSTNKKWDCALFSQYLYAHAPENRNKIDDITDPLYLRKSKNGCINTF